MVSIRFVLLLRKRLLFWDLRIGRNSGPKNALQASLSLSSRQTRSSELRFLTSLSADSRSSSVSVRHEFGISHCSPGRQWLTQSMNEAISASSSVLSCGVSSIVGRFASLMGHLVGHPPAFLFSGFAASFVVAVPPVPLLFWVPWFSFFCQFPIFLNTTWTSSFAISLLCSCA